MSKLFLLVAGIYGGLAVVLGAFGAHGLKGKISDSLLAAYQTGVHYQMFHTLAIMALTLLLLRSAMPSSVLTVAGYFWIAGIILFSGSLYGLALGLGSWLGPITPIGGLLLIIGWICFVVGVARTPF